MNRVWIKGKKSEFNVSAVFAGNFNVKENCVLRVCAKPIYNVYIDGEFAGNGPSRCAHRRNEIDSFDLSEYAGRSVVVTVEVLSYNVNCFEATRDEPYFSAEIVCGKDVLYTTEDFTAFEGTDKLQKTARYSYQRAFSEYYVENTDIRNRIRNGDFSALPQAQTEESGKNEILTERSVKYPTYDTVCGIKFQDGTFELDENATVFDDRFLFHNAQSAQGNGFCDDELERNPVEFVSKIKYLKNGDGKSGKYAFYDFGAEYSGFSKLTLEVTSPNATVYYLFDEILTELENGEKIVFPFRMRTVNFVSYELGKGNYVLQSAEPYSFRYAAVVVCNGEAEIKSAEIVKFENPDIDKLRFWCADSDYEKIIDAAKATFAQNSVDLFTDCPSRERGGWLCDSYFTSMAEKLLTGENVIERHFFENYGNCPYFSYFEDGVVPMVYPGDYEFERYIPNWMMWYIIELANSMERNGDDFVTEESKVKVRNLIKYFERYENSDGLLEKLPSWVFVEWSRANDLVQDVNYPSNMCYCGTLKAASKILGGVPELCEKAEKIRNYIRNNARLGKLYIDNALRKENGVLENTQNTTETCQYYAFYFGVATPEEDAELFDFIVKELGAGRDDTKVHPNIPKSNAFIGNYLRLDFLAKNGYADSVAQQCKGYFLYMAEKTGTLWENDTTRASCNHGFASYAANILIMGICGVRLIANKKIYTVPTNFGDDCEIDFPCADGYVKVTVKDGKRTVTAPEGYEIV